MSRIFHFRDVDLSNYPFEHFSLTNVYTPDFNNKLLQWLRDSAQWKLVEADFYEQYEFSFWDVELPPGISTILDESNIAELCDFFEGVFGVKLDNTRVDITAHKLLPGQRIRIHNDFIPESETHRFVIQLNDGWKEEKGGLLMLFASPNPEYLTHIITPQNNSAIGFAISQNSFHAVSKVYEGQRYTVVYSFYSK